MTPVLFVLASLLTATPPTYEAEVEVRLRVIDVRVTDKKSRFVPGLEEQAFQVLEEDSTKCGLMGFTALGGIDQTEIASRYQGVGAQVFDQSCSEITVIIAIASQYQVLRANAQCHLDIAILAINSPRKRK